MKIERPYQIFYVRLLTFVNYLAKIVASGYSWGPIKLGNWLKEKSYVTHNLFKNILSCQICPGVGGQNTS